MVYNVSVSLALALYDYACDTRIVICIPVM